MLWLNSYHKGFNRLWVVFSCLLAFAFVGLRWLARAYEPRMFPPTQGGEYRVAPRGRSRASSPKPKPMTEAEKQAKQKKEAEREAELKAYQTRQKWIERGRAMRDLLASFIVAFVIGHGGFCLVVWIIRGFR